MSDSTADSATVGLESVDTFCYLGNMLSAEVEGRKRFSLSGEMCWGQVQ